MTSNLFVTDAMSSMMALIFSVPPVIELWIPQSISIQKSPPPSFGNLSK
jgi:hypothetical protein